MVVARVYSNVIMIQQRWRREKTLGASLSRYSWTCLNLKTGIVKSNFHEDGGKAVIPAEREDVKQEN
jgi:hypothetical protein